MPFQPKQLQIIEKIDKQGMLKAVEDFPRQCQEAVSIAKSISLNIDLPKVSSILILGMGGSGISGDIIKVLLEGELSIPILVNKDYTLPNFVDEKSLCFALSYSGNTEETLNGFDQALGRGSCIISIATGGILAKRAHQHRLPLIKIPSGFQPRAALGYLTLPILVILARLNLVKNQTEEIKETLNLLKKKESEWNRKKPLEKNETQMLALKLSGKVPIVYGSQGVTGVAALRWKCQFNENSKIPSFWHTFPELNHNETVGWELLKSVTQKFCLILLRDKDGEERIKRRIAITKSLIEKQFGQVLQVWAEGKSKLAKTFSLIYFGDFTSAYLAILNGVDPTPVQKVEILKKKLAESAFRGKGGLSHQGCKTGF